MPKNDKLSYCNKNVATPRATNFTYQPRVHKNLEVTMLFAQVKVKVLHVVTINLARDPRGSKPNFYRARRSLFFMKEEKIYPKGELLYYSNEEINM